MKRGREHLPRRRVDGIVLLDKPLGLSSNDALQRVKRIFNAEKAGHTGSLDPLATGLLPVCLGEATKLCGELLDGDKHYRATVVLGTSTTTGDLEGEVKATSDPSGITDVAAREVLNRFIGTTLQIPPMHSALKHQGQALYKLAREGQQVERAPREVRIHRLELMACQNDRMELDVICSKGTYIRTLAEDIGFALGQQAHLAALRRLSAHPFDAPVTMHTLDALSAAAGQGNIELNGFLLPSAEGLRHWPQWIAEEWQLSVLAQGGVLAAQGLIPGRVAVVDAQGRLRGMAGVDNDRVFPRRWLLVND